MIRSLRLPKVFFSILPITIVILAYFTYTDSMQTLKHTITHILNANPALRQIVNKVDQLAKLNRTLNTAAPELSPYCQAANVRANTLLLTTPSSALGHKLRFQAQELLERFNQHSDQQFKSVQILVRPDQHFSSAPPLKPTQISEDSARMIEDAAEGITSIPLKQAMLRLANRKS